MSRYLIDLEEVFILRKHNMRLNSKKCAFRVSLGKFLGYMVNNKGTEANSDKIWDVLDMAPPKTFKDVQ